MAEIKTLTKRMKITNTHRALSSMKHSKAAEGKDASVRYGDGETGFKTKKKNVRTRDRHIHWIHSRE